MILMLPFTNQLKDLYKKRIPSRKSVQKYPFLIFFRKMLMLTFLFRFKVNYLEKMLSYRNFSLWIPIALTKISFIRMVLI